MGVQLQTPQDLLEIYKALNIISYALASAAVGANGGILLAFCIRRIRKPSTCPITPAGVLVLNLLVADCLGPIACLYAARFKLWPENARAMAKYRYICPIRFAGGFLGFIGSHMALLCVVLDRYIAVLHTLRYREVMTISKSVKILVIGWIVPVAGALTIMIKNEWHEGVETCTENTIMSWFFAHIWVPTTVIAFICIAAIQAVVHFEINRRSKSDSALAIVLRRVTRKSARVLLQSTTIFVVCWGLFDTTLLIYLFYPHKFTKLAYDISFPIAVSSFLSNPTLFSFKTESIRKPVIALCKDVRSFIFCKNVEASPASSVHGVNVPCGIHNGMEKKLSLSGQTFTDTIIDYNVV